MTDGTRLCLDCRNEWDPATVPALRAVPEPPPEYAGTPWPPGNGDPASTAATADPAAADSVLGPPESVVAADAAQAALDALVGHEAVLEGGQVVTVLAFPDDDHVTVQAASGDRFDVAWSDVERTVEPAAPAGPVLVEVPDETAVALARVNMAVAGLALRAGLASLAGEYPDAQLITPPTGWLPDDADTMPVVEQGTAYAVAFLIHAYRLDREVVGRIADTLIEDSQEPTMKGEDQ